MPNFIRTNIEMISKASYFAFLTTVIAFLWPSSPFNPPNTVEGSMKRQIELSKFNKSINARIRHEDFFRRLGSLKPGKRTKIPSKSIKNSPKRLRTDRNETDTKKPPPSPVTTNNANLRSGKGNFPMLRPIKIERNTLYFDIEPSIVGGKTIVSVQLYVYIKKREPKRKMHGAGTPSSGLITTRELSKRGRRRNRRNRMIKIRVFKSDKDGSKGSRIAELKKKITKSSYQTIALPLSLVKSFTNNSNSSTLPIRVECSRCNRKTRLILPGNNKKRCHRRRKSRRRKSKNKSQRPLRKKRRRHCARTRSLDDTNKNPFIVVEKSEQRMPRFKRSIGSIKTCVSQFPRKSTPTSSNISKPSNSSTVSCCRKIETFVTFKDLNLENEVIYPPGFNFVTCSSTCSMNNKMLRQRQKLQRDVVKSAALNIHTKFSHIQNVKPQSRSITVRKISHILNRSRLKLGLSQSSHSCSPVKKEDLNLLHFTDDFSLVQLEQPDFLVSDCQCSSS